MIAGETQSRVFNLPPWDVQKAITFGIIEQIDHLDESVARNTALHMAVRHFLGSGVERDVKETLHFMRKAAEIGSIEARHVVERLHGAFGHDYSGLFLNPLEDSSDDEQASIIMSAMRAAEYVTPWHSVDLVSQRQLLHAKNACDFGIHEFAYLGLIHELDNLFDEGYVDYADDQSRTALYLACWGGHLSAIKSLIAHGSDASIGDDDGYTPLHLLIMLPEADVAEALNCIVQSSTAVNINSFATEPLELPEGWIEVSGAPLHWTIASRNRSMVIALLEQGADIISWDTEKSPVHLAVSLHLYDILELLLQPRFLPSIEPLRHQESPFFALNASDPIWRTVIHGKHWKEAISRTIGILARQWDINEISHPDLGLTPLTKIAYTNISEADVEIASCLLQQCKPGVSSKGLTALQAAIIGLRGVPLASHTKIVHVLLDAGVSPRTVSSNIKPGWNSLHWAVATNAVSVAQEILRRDPNLLHVVTSDEEEETPLHLASLTRLEMLEMLLNYGANPATETKRTGLTPLGMYLSDQRSETDAAVLTRLLIASKANDYIAFRRDEEAWTVIHYAVSRAAILNVDGIQGQQLLQRLLNDYPDLRNLLDVRTKHGWTALHLAAYDVGYAAVRLLCEAGANVLLETPQSSDAFNIVMERARHAPSKRLRGDVSYRWVSSAYRTAKVLMKHMAERNHIIDLSKLHIAAYMGYYDKVVRLVHKGMDPWLKVGGESPAQMLRGSLFNANPQFMGNASRVLDFLESRAA
jgi:ankyrin repeat protein